MNRTLRFVLSIVLACALVCPSFVIDDRAYASQPSQAKKQSTSDSKEDSSKATEAKKKKAEEQKKASTFEVSKSSELNKAIVKITKGKTGTNLRNIYDYENLAKELVHAWL